MTIKNFLYNDFTSCYKVEDRTQYNTNSFEIENEPQNIFYFPPLLCFGDYDNSCHVERSNSRVFLEEFGKDKDVIHLKVGYGEVIGIRLTCENEEIIETLEALANYPCLNDEDCSLMEMEMQEESWESFGESDFKNQIMKHWDLLDITPEKSLWEYYSELIDAQNKYIEIESGGNVYFPSPELPEEIPGFLHAEFYA